MRMLEPSSGMPNGAALGAVALDFHDSVSRAGATTPRPTAFC